MSGLVSPDVQVTQAPKEMASPQVESKTIGQRTKEDTEALDPREKVVKILEELQNQAKIEQVEKAFPAKTILGDGEKIEGHTIDFIQQKDKTIVYFKTTSGMTNEISSNFIPNLSKEQVSDGKWEFQSASGSESVAAGDCWIIEADDKTKIYISKGGVVHEQRLYDWQNPIKDESGKIIDTPYKVTGYHLEQMRSMLGAVKIEVQGTIEAKQIADKVEAAFQTLGIIDALAPPDQQTENVYKEARFRWHHKLDDEKAWQAYKERYKAENGVELLDHLQRQEVFPGYSTVIDNGATERYAKDGEITLTHDLYSTNYDHFLPVLKSGLFSTYERWKRGMLTSGFSTGSDFGSGGADSVFLRYLPNVDNASTWIKLLINPRVLDRTDWYAYNYDQCGSTVPETFNQRSTPEDFFNEQRQDFSIRNEIVMRHGIPAEMIAGVRVSTDSFKQQITRNAIAEGIKEVNGVPIEEFVQVSVPSYSYKSRSNEQIAA